MLVRSASDSCRAKGSEADLALHEVMDGVDEVTEVAAKAIELPNNQRVAFAQRLEAGLQAGPIVLLPDARSS